jgi:hypothetical protein
MFLMFLQIIAINQNVIELGCNKYIQIGSQHIIDEVLEASGYIG